MFYEQESYRYEQTRFKSRVNVYIYECRKCIESDVSKTAFLKKSSIVITNVFRCNLSDFISHVFDLGNSLGSTCVKHGFEMQQAWHWSLYNDETWFQNCFVCVELLKGAVQTILSRY